MSGCQVVTCPHCTHVILIGVGGGAGGVVEDWGRVVLGKNGVAGVVIAQRGGGRGLRKG